MGWTLARRERMKKRLRRESREKAKKGLCYRRGCSSPVKPGQKMCSAHFAQFAKARRQHGYTCDCRMCVKLRKLDEPEVHCTRCMLGGHTAESCDLRIDEFAGMRHSVETYLETEELSEVYDEGVSIKDRAVGSKLAVLPGRPPVAVSARRVRKTNVH